MKPTPHTAVPGQRKLLPFLVASTIAAGAAQAQQAAPATAPAKDENQLDTITVVFFAGLLPTRS